MAHDQQNKYSLHGVAISINGCGICIIGEPGIGKSELGLSLIDRGHNFIADDIVACHPEQKKVLINADPNNHGYIHIRGIGFLNIAQLYPNIPLCNNSELNLIIELSNQAQSTEQLLQQQITHETLLGIQVNKVHLSVGQNRPLALIVETLVKQYILCQNGYDSHKIFIEQHAQTIKNNEMCTIASLRSQ